MYKHYIHIYIYFISCFLHIVSYFRTIVRVVNIRIQTMYKYKTILIIMVDIGNMIVTNVLPGFISIYSCER